MTNANFSIINLSECLNSKRIDAEYFKPEYLENQKLIKQKSFKSLDEISIDIKSYGAYSLTNLIHYEDTGIPYIRCTDIKDGVVDFSQVLFVDEKSHDLLSKSEIKKNMVLLCMSGTVGNSAVANEDWKYPINSNQDVAKIVLNSDINPYFVSTFFSCKYGRNQILRLPIGSVQQHVFIWQLKTLSIPNASKDFQDQIEELIKISQNKRTESANKLLEVEQLLISHIGFTNFIASPVNYSSRNSKDVFSAQRLDGEYWLPMYDEILNIINSYSGGSTRIGSSFNQVKSNFKAEKELKYKYIEIGDINISQPEYSFTELFGNELPANAKIMLKSKTLITSKVRPSRGATALIDSNEYIASGAFVALQEKDMNLETLYAYLKLAPIKELLLRYNTGTSYPTITDRDVLNLPLPNITTEVQSEIKNKVISSTKLLNDSKVLLDVAKRAVEVFIEQDEDTALDYIKQNYEQV